MMEMFNKLIDTLKANPKRIVFTEGTDARILEASARLLTGSWLKPVLVGNVEAVKKAAADHGFNSWAAPPTPPPTPSVPPCS